MALEGGYHLEGLKDSVKAVLRELAGLQGIDIDQLAAGADPKRLNYILWRIRGVHAKYWRNLNLPSAEAIGFKPSIRDLANETLARLAAYFRS
jgi:hypothetical protein